MDNTTLLIVILLINGGFAYSRLIRSLKGNRPDQVVSILKIITGCRGAIAS